MDKNNGAAPHVPVLLEAVLDGLHIRPNGTYIDGTLGRGGHSREILQQLGPEGRLIAIDRDPEAVSEAGEQFARDARMEIVRGEFGELDAIGRQRQLGGNVDGILLDLGVSSPQLDRAERGFSFRHDGPLDMRMDPDHGQSAASWLAAVTEQELRRVLHIYGEEKSARRIAAAIVAARLSAPIESTAALAAVVESEVPRRGARIHPATRTFQAIRMLINDELGQLERALDAVIDLLATGGRLCVISFHSLEDRIVKRFIRNASRVAEAYRGLPDVPAEYRARLAPVGKLRVADDAEIERNPRSRSARLRIAERLAS